MLNVTTRLVISSYQGLFEYEINEIKEAVEERLRELDLPPHVLKSIQFEEEQTPLYDDEDIEALG